MVNNHSSFINNHWAMAAELQNLPNRLNSPKIENPGIYVPLRYLYICRDSSTFVERALQISSFMQNKANLLKAQMNVSKVLTKDYENKTLGERGKNKPNSKPIQTQSNPISEKPKMDISSILTKHYENIPLFTRGENKPNTNPNKANPPAPKPRLPLMEVDCHG